MGGLGPFSIEVTEVSSGRSSMGSNCLFGRIVIMLNMRRGGIGDISRQTVDGEDFLFGWGGRGWILGRAVAVVVRRWISIDVWLEKSADNERGISTPRRESD